MTRTAIRSPTPSSACPDAAREVRLAELGDRSGVILRVGLQDRDSLAVLERLGLVPGARIEVIELAATGVRVEIGGDRFLVPTGLANEIWLEEGAR